jgi:hypothetical protein
MLKPAIVFPFHDPEGIMFEHLKVILPLLKQTFSEAFLSITSSTNAKYPSNVRRLQEDQFFSLHILPNDIPVGKHFYSLFEHASSSSQPDQILHLCFIDRLVFALQSNHRDQFIEDVKSVKSEHTPLIFHRSPKAWNTHPRNYYEIEKFVTIIGELVLGKTLDFAWCHLVMQASWLMSILHRVQNADISIMAELILHSSSNINTQNVDWLEWEDPFFSSYGACELKRLREESLEETQKRLSYAIPMVQKIIKHTQLQGLE